MTDQTERELEFLRKLKVLIKEYDVKLDYEETEGTTFQLGDGEPHVFLYDEKADEMEYWNGVNWIMT